MRPSILLCLALLLVPAALAGHTPTRDLAGEVGSGASIVLALDATGTLSSQGSGTQERGSSTTSTTHAYTFSYSWGGTVELHLGADGTLQGDAQLSGSGSGSLLDRSNTKVRDHEGDVVNEIVTERDCHPRIGLFNDGKLHATGFVDGETGELVVVIRSITTGAGERDCTFTSEGNVERSALFPRPPMSPLLVEGIRAIQAGDERVERAAPGLDEVNAATALILSIPLQNGHTIVRGHGSAALPVEYGSEPLGYACPPPIESQFVQGTCRASGSLSVRVLVDPCPVLRESRAVHLAAVKAMQKPAAGSSESQVRAFSVDARQKAQALLADERGLQLVCGEDAGAVALSELLALQSKVLEAWIDVAKTHGLSDEGKRDLLGAERGRQLMGGDDGDAEVAAAVGAVIENAGQHGAIAMTAHSPVALHAWDEEGRHVGWNETTESVDVQIPGANYTGLPGEGQALTLPSGFYKLATVELEAGSYLLRTGWNASGAEDVEILPLASQAGRTLVSNVLLDAYGMLTGPLQRVASASAAFVEPWAPLAAEPAPVIAGDSGARGEAAREDASVPSVGAALLLLAMAALAVARRR